MHNNSIKSSRILSLDVFRGLTMALMIIVNSQDSTLSYPILEHARWNGCTLADLVFPFFLYIVGLTTVISLQKHSVASYSAIFKRSILLFLLGLFLNAFPNHFDFSNLRLFGILQRIAICYLVCSIIYLNTTVKTQILIFSGILIGYCAVMTMLPVPGFGAGNLTIAGNWVGYLDRLVLPVRHSYLHGSFDPEGLLSTTPAIATTLSGVLTASFLLTQRSKQNKCYLIIAMGLGAVDN